MKSMRLIDADKIPFRDLSEGKRLCIVAFASDINQMPTIEPKKGKWIGNDDFDEFFRCSLCGFGETQFDHTWNFCPNCGSFNGGDTE